MIRSQNIIPTFTWANKPSSYITGQPVFISNAGTKGSHWFYDGTRWKPLNGSAMLASLDTASASIGSSETIVFQYLIPANLWQTADRLRFWLGMTKSGTTDTGAMWFRIGTAGTTADALIIGANEIAAANQQAGLVRIRLCKVTAGLDPLKDHAQDPAEAISRVTI